MKTCPRMQKIITRLAKKHGLDLAAHQAHLRLENGPFMPLVIEKIGRHLVSVTHYFVQNGDQVADPDVVFFSGYGPWVPIEITQVYPGGYRCYAELSADGNEIDRINRRGQADLARFVEGSWARNLKGQGWLERGQRLQEE